jgi:hypothetical protein
MCELDIVLMQCTRQLCSAKDTDVTCAAAAAAAAAAGNAIIHFVDTAFLDESQRSFWSVQRDMACAKESPVITSISNNGSSQPGLSVGVVAAIAIVGTIAVAAMIAAVTMYLKHAKLRRSRQQQQQPTLLDAEAEDGLGAGMSRPGSGPQHGRTFTNDSANSGHVLSDAERGELDQDHQQLLHVVEPKPVVSPEKLDLWLQLQQGRQQQLWAGAAAAAAAAAGVPAGPAAAAAAGGVDSSGSGSSDSSGAALKFAEKLARDLDPEHGNPNIR